MKLESDIKVNGKNYAKGADIPWRAVYPFFLLHMLIFGGSGFFLAYGAKDVDTAFLYMHGGIAILIYTIFYLAIFGVDEVKWMFLNAALGCLGIYTQIGWLLSLFGRKVSDYPWYIHVIPFLYYVLYTFLIRHAVIDLLNARDNPAKKKLVENIYVAFSVTVYLLFYFLEKK